MLSSFTDAGGTLIDTAASYGAGLAESTLGDLLGDVCKREDIIIVSKAGIRMRKDSSWPDASRKNLLDTLDGSLQRLRTEYLDLWLVQAPDNTTPLEETLAALQEAVQAGKVRYVGLSNFPAWRAAQAATLLSPTLAGLGSGITAVETEYSLLCREPEVELIPASVELGFGVLAWSALGRGVLTGKYRSNIPPDSRAASMHLASFVRPYLHDSYRQIVEGVATAAEGLGKTTLEVALAWLLGNHNVASSIVGCRNSEQLTPVLKATDWALPPQLQKALDDISA